MSTDYENTTRDDASTTINNKVRNKRTIKPKPELKAFYGNDPNEIQVGVDEAGRGSFAGPVFAAAVILDPKLKDPEVKMIRDSKQLSKKKREELRQYIENNAIAFSVQSSSAVVIDEINILQATYRAMHQCLRHLSFLETKFERILVDGEHFKPFACQIHNCIPKGDNEYLCIAAASILAKTYHDEWIQNACAENPELDAKYKWLKNMGYGTKEHRDGISEHGICEFHRKTFVQKYI